MFTLSNILSLLRGPLALLFLIDRIDVRVCTVLVAMISDCFDGYLARLYKHTTKLGAILDPLMDKFFVFFVLGVLFFENRLTVFELVAMLSRDIALFIFAIYLIIRNRWRNYQYKSMRWGKITTALQFPVLFFLALKIPVHPVFFILFLTFGILVLVELFFTTTPTNKKV